jgi:hypothetical protein
MKLFRTLVLGLLAAMGSPFALAAELDITARFRPSAAEPNITQFVNTTPLSGYCAQFSNLCRPGDVTITIPFSVERIWQIPGPLEGHNYQRVDGTWKTIQVFSDAGGQPFDVRFRINMLSRNHLLGTLEPDGVLGSIGSVSSGAGVNGSSVGGCSGRTGMGNAGSYSFAWMAPEAFQTCSRPATSPNVIMGPYRGTIEQISIGYDLVAPNPLQLPNGTYTGQVSYSIGRGKQLDLGLGEYSDDIVNFNLTLSVEHQIRVDFPANSDHVLLEPDGGWLNWLNKGRRPTRLYREQPFRLWASAPLHMYLTCGHTMGNRCGITNERTHEHVPVDIAVSLPDAFRYQGQTVQKLALPVGKHAALTFEAVRPLLNGRSLLHYSVAEENLEGMLKNAGTTYKGDVTIMFDAQI